MQHEDGIQPLSKKIQRTKTQQVKLSRFPDTKSSSILHQNEKKSTVLYGSRLNRERFSFPNILECPPSDFYHKRQSNARPNPSSVDTKSRTTTLQSIYGCFRHIMWQRGISWRSIKWLPWRVLFGGCVAAALALIHGQKKMRDRKVLSYNSSLSTLYWGSTRIQRALCGHKLCPTSVLVLRCDVIKGEASTIF